MDRIICAKNIFFKRNGNEPSYRDAANDIVSNCATYVYLGGSDVYTAEQISKRAQIPMGKVLAMPYGECLVFRLGQDKLRGQTYTYKENGLDVNF